MTNDIDLEQAKKLCLENEYNEARTHIFVMYDDKVCCGPNGEPAGGQVKPLDFNVDLHYPVGSVYSSVAEVYYITSISFRSMPKRFDRGYTLHLSRKNPLVEQIRAVIKEELSKSKGKWW